MLRVIGCCHSEETSLSRPIMQSSALRAKGSEVENDELELSLRRPWRAVPSLLEPTAEGKGAASSLGEGGGWWWESNHACTICAPAPAPAA